MAIVLDGTSGITNDSGYTGDGVSFADSTPADTLVTTSDGNVGIGTSSPSAPLQVGDTNTTPSAFPAGSVVFSGASAGGTESVFSFGRGDSGVFNTGVTFSFTPARGTTGNATGWYQRVDGATAAGFMSFGQLIRAASGNATLTERARIDSGGNLLVGKTAADNALLGLDLDPGGRINLSRTGTTSTTQVGFYRNGSATAVGTISTTSTATAYNTSSDYRLKHDIQPMQNALATVAALKPVTYKWNADDSQSQGFIAHELQEVVPECVTGEKDAVDAEGNPQYQGIDTSFLVATLTAAIQEQQAIITALTARVEALEGAQA
jgi:hypothetical protein